MTQTISPGVTAAIATLRARMLRDSCGYDKAFLRERQWLKKQRCGDGCRTAWTDMATDFEAAYKVLATEAKNG